MKRALRYGFLTLLILAVITLITLYFVTHEIAVLEPDGMIGKRERDLFLDTSLLMLLVVIPAVGLGLLFAWKYRAGNKKAPYKPEWEHSDLAEAIWWVVPLVIISVIGVITWETSHSLDPFKPIENGKKPLTIQVVALEWKWLFLYPEQQIATVNYIQIPEQTPVRFEITADAPMNSFWIPKLGGQIYAMPAMRSELYLIADTTGSFNGFSSNISGTGFAGMQFEVKATSEEEFNRWVDSVQSSTKEMDWAVYEKLVEPSQYNPTALYKLTDESLFMKILDQYQPGEK